MNLYKKALGAGMTGSRRSPCRRARRTAASSAPDGSVERVAIDFDVIQRISKVAREEYGLAGAVQHGASTLPPEYFGHFPDHDCAEIHLATDFMNTVYDHPAFPYPLKREIERWLDENAAEERKRGETQEQFLYKTRKKAIGPYKEQVWNLPEGTRVGDPRHAREEVRVPLRQAAASTTRATSCASTSSRCRCTPRRSRRARAAASCATTRRETDGEWPAKSAIRCRNDDRGRQDEAGPRPLRHGDPPGSRPQARTGRGADPRARDRRLRLGQAHLPVGRRRWRACSSRRASTATSSAARSSRSARAASGRTSRRDSTSRPRCTSPTAPAGPASPDGGTSARTRGFSGVHGDGCFAQYVVVPAFNVVPLDRAMIPPKVGAFLDALGNAVHTTQVTDLSGKSVAVLGYGPDRRDVRRDRAHLGRRANRHHRGQRPRRGARPQVGEDARPETGHRHRDPPDQGPRRQPRGGDRRRRRRRPRALRRRVLDQPRPRRRPPRRRPLAARHPPREGRHDPRLHERLRLQGPHASTPSSAGASSTRGSR